MKDEHSEHSERFPFHRWSLAASSGAMVRTRSGRVYEVVGISEKDGWCSENCVHYSRCPGQLEIEGVGSVRDGVHFCFVYFDAEEATPGKRNNGWGGLIQRVWRKTQTQGGTDGV